MKRFLKYISLYGVGILILLCLLDVLYTQVYIHAFPRNKTQYILSLNEGERIDYVFLGSSRVENGIAPKEIEKLTGKRTLNLGTQAAKFKDINLFLRLLVDKGVVIEHLLIQVDYIFNFDTSSDIVRSQALPYIRTNPVINSYLKRVDTDYFKQYYFPFYRYATNDYRLGFREFFASATGKPSNIDFEDGFVPLQGRMEKGVFSFPKKIKAENRSFNEIDSICKANAIKVTYFCAPFCQRIESNDYFVQLKNKITNFKDFSRVIEGDSLFKNCSHLNEQGAYEFSKILVKQLDL